MLKILLSNDDGVDAPGIASLYNNLVDIAELFVVAPAINQSGAGCSITTNRPLKVKKFKENFISVNGLSLSYLKGTILTVCLPIEGFQNMFFPPPLL